MWTTTTLLYRKKGKTILPSILGRLLSGFLNFETTVHQLSFVSNFSVSAKLKDNKSSDSLTKLRYADLSDKEREKIKSRIVDELGDGTIEQGLELLVFERSSLSVDDQQIHCLGVLTSFLVSQSLPTDDATAFCNTLHGEIRRRSRRELLPSTGSELKNLKSLSRAEFTEMLNRLRPEASLSDIVAFIRESLVAEGCSTIEAFRISASIRKVASLRLDPSNIPIQEAIPLIEAAISETNEESSLSKVIEEVFDSTKAEISPLIQIEGDRLVKGMIGLLYFENEESQIQNTGEESPEAQE